MTIPNLSFASSDMEQVSNRAFADTTFGAVTINNGSMWPLVIILLIALVAVLLWIRYG